MCCGLHRHVLVTCKKKLPGTLQKKTLGNKGFRAWQNKHYRKEMELQTIRKHWERNDYAHL